MTFVGKILVIVVVAFSLDFPRNLDGELVHREELDSRDPEGPKQRSVI